MSKVERFPCWSCKESVSMRQRANADGDCPHCGVELDLEDWPAKQVASTHPLITALHENGDLIAAQATIAQQAQMIEHLRGGPTPLYTAVDVATAAADGFRDGAASHWQSMETCPKHVDVLFFHERNRVIPGRLTDADSFMSDKERDEFEGGEEAQFCIDAFGFGHWGVDRMEGTEAPTHWMPYPPEPEAKP